MKTKAMTSILALAVLTVTVALAQERFDMLVRQDFFAGFNGNREALERGMKITEDTLAKDPNHAEARVWHGSGILYLSGQAFQKGDQQNGMKLWRQGLDEMGAGGAAGSEQCRSSHSARRYLDHHSRK